MTQQQIGLFVLKIYKWLSFQCGRRRRVISRWDE